VLFAVFAAGVPLFSGAFAQGHGKPPAPGQGATPPPAGKTDLRRDGAASPAGTPDAGDSSLKGYIFQESKPIDITSDSLKVFHKDHYGLFTGHVVADRKDVKLHCEELRTEMDEKDLVERLICKGKVLIFMGQKEARGDKAVFDNKTDLITVTGNPSLKDGEDFMEGEIVLMNLTDDTVQIEKPRGKIKTKPKEEKPAVPVPQQKK